MQYWCGYVVEMRNVAAADANMTSLLDGNSTSSLLVNATVPVKPCESHVNNAFTTFTVHTRRIGTAVIPSMHSVKFVGLHVSLQMVKSCRVISS